MAALPAPRILQQVFRRVSAHAGIHAARPTHCAAPLLFSLFGPAWMCYICRPCLDMPALIWCNITHKWLTMTYYSLTKRIHQWIIYLGSDNLPNTKPSKFARKCIQPPNIQTRSPCPNSDARDRLLWRAYSRPFRVDFLERWIHTRCV